jgi:hypothetical protein
MAKRKKAKPNYMGWVVGIVIVVVIVLLVMRMAPEEVAEEAVEPGKVSKVQEAPTLVDKCDLNYVIGPAKRCTVDNGVGKQAVMNSGKGTIPGMWFMAETVDGKSAYFKSGESVGVKETKEYTLELADWAGELGSDIRSVTIYPQTTAGEACLNQRIQVLVSKCA